MDKIKLILDTNIILREPRILGVESKSYELIIPLDVVDELRERAEKRGDKLDRRLKLIEKAASLGNVSVLNSDAPSIRGFRERLHNERLSGADLSIISIASFYIQKNFKVIIATIDSDLIKIANKSGINTISSLGILNLNTPFSEEALKSGSIQEEIVLYEKNEWKTLLLNVLSGIIVSIIIYISYKYVPTFFKTINIWGTFILTVLIGVLLYLMREKQKLAYGILEFIIGIAVIVYPLSLKNFDYSKVDFNLEFDLKLLGGLYIIVRSIDNIVKSQQDKKIGLWLKDNIGIG